MTGWLQSCAPPCAVLGSDLECDKGVPTLAGENAHPELVWLDHDDFGGRAALTGRVTLDDLLAFVPDLRHAAEETAKTFCA